ncbi:hypothetical protein HYH03_012246 [Edaphochlamys debaryana]|uniref:Uncharacterized protein n=1 Tax=Edaphochlamys debaryana TaxID=47281 RepID=A0A835XT28_9CHLO|nr:hypothetical protein HYH03_012246 [Edaphochlamys debaryana]|eukprot:KAG2489224.1 hypothetical protein HYH03_012246 [Edaphochlamys debaryana]
MESEVADFAAENAAMEAELAELEAKYAAVEAALEAENAIRRTQLATLAVDRILFTAATVAEAATAGSSCTLDSAPSPLRPSSSSHSSFLTPAPTPIPTSSPQPSPSPPDGPEPDPVAALAEVLGLDDAERLAEDLARLAKLRSGLVRRLLGGAARPPPPCPRELDLAVAQQQPLLDTVRRFGPSPLAPPGRGPAGGLPRHQAPLPGALPGRSGER